MGISGFDVRPVGGSLGAEVHGVDLRTVDDTEREELRDLLHEFEVLFFPGAGLSEDEHMALGRRFGEVAIFPMSRLFGATEPEVEYLDATRHETVSQSLKQRQRGMADVATERDTLRREKLGVGEAETVGQVRIQLVRHPAADVIGLEGRQAAHFRLRAWAIISSPGRARW